MNQAKPGTTSEQRWAGAVRVLGLLSLVLLVMTVFEARSLRLARAELQQLRDARRARPVGTTPVQVDDLRTAVRWLDAAYADPASALGREGGLCAGGQLDADALATFVGGAFLPARLAGGSLDDAMATMKKAVAERGAREVGPRP